jgi:hypothetical protein
VRVAVADKPVGVRVGVRVTVADGTGDVAVRTAVGLAVGVRVGAKVRVGVATREAGVAVTSPVLITALTFRAERLILATDTPLGAPL